MDEELWFEEEIGPAEGTVQATAAGVKGLDAAAWAKMADETAGLGPLLGSLEGLTKAQQAAAVEAYARERLKGIIRVFRPGIVALAPGATGRGSDALPYARGDAYLVRLSVEFDLPEELRAARYRYKKVYCRSELTADDAACRPTVLEVYPNHVYQGKPRIVKVEFKPALTWHEVEAGLGSATTDVQVGVVAPATVGFLGDEQRKPYWEMTEQQQEIRGRYHFWFVLDLPAGCDLRGMWLGVLGEGDLRFHLGPFPMGPKRRQREGVMRPIRLADVVQPGR